MQTQLRLAEQDRLANIERANAEAAEAERQRIESEREIEIDRRAERHQQQLEGLTKQMEQLVWATKLQHPKIPMGPGVKDVLINELESMRVPEISMGSIMAAYENLFARGTLVPDYSRSARANAIELAEKARRNGLEIDFSFEKDPSEMSAEEAQALMRKLPSVNVGTMKALSEQLEDYHTYKERKKSPAGKGTRRASGL
ncbi:MAG TPA: hypothetical protein VHR84_03310 [Terriglobales bacterium]|nr:hypothetical protein [Terriglobales bacterium]